MATKNHNERSKEFENNWNFNNINLNDGYIPFEYKNTSAAFTFDASKQSKLRSKFCILIPEKPNLIQNK